MRQLVRQLLQFALVGGVGFVVDVGVFNALRVTVLSPERVHEGPLLAKVVSTILAIGCNWIGNRYWTFASERRVHAAREGVEFAIVSVVGLSIGLACLGVSHYVLGFTSVLADNISSNVVGLVLGTAFRFALYKWWVFAPHRGGGSGGPRVPPGARAGGADAPSDAGPALPGGRAADGTSAVG